MKEFAEKYKKIIIAVIVILFLVLLYKCGGSGGNNYSDSSYKSKYDRDAEYVGDQFGKDSQEVKDSVDRLAGAMK